MKIIIASLMATALVAGCNTVSLDLFIKNHAVQACNNASRAYQVYVATDPAPKQLAKVNAYYQNIHDLCMDPESITSQEIAIVIAQAYAMKKLMK